MILALSCSSTGIQLQIHFSDEANTFDSIHRNKHIMIDLGTGNNNKMFVYFIITIPAIH